MTIPEKSLILFCDGACSGNPGPGGWGVVAATPQGDVWELGGFSALTTNNQMELTAAIEGLKSMASLEGKILLYTDSTYVIRGITQWIHGWRKKGWRTAEGKDVVNRELWEELSQWVSRRGKAHPISWRYVRGHAGILGNERADEIAVAFSKRQKFSLYRGSLLRYPFALHDLLESADGELPEMRPKSAEKTRALAYLSLVGGKLARHSSWTECEARVKGVSGAKFRKIMTEEEESKVLRDWGVSDKNWH